MEDSNKNLIVADGVVIGPPQTVRAVSVYHYNKNPVGHLTAPKKAIAVGTGTVAGFVWKKASTTSNNTDWVQVLP